ncbi:hypothetical protein BYT27DRAFT_7123770 [Phlegmacium glaucopus]|nr:hypothetical protein BYT27DRAFT_7123770 [Phlegmacium glaucopus]
MLGIEDYGSDSDASDSPKQSAATSNPPSKTKRAPKKITISLPSLPAAGSAENSDDERPAKKRRTGAGTSSLLSMLPMPKQKTVPQSRAVIGVGKTEVLDLELSTETPVSEPVSLTFKPGSLGKGKRNISIEEVSINQATRPRRSPEATPATDFFALGHAKGAAKNSNDSASSSSSLSLPSAAPSLPTFEPPEPTPMDPYPGYYQLPSGVWAAYDPEYYAKFMKKWEHDYNSQLRALEKGTIKGFEGLQDAPVEEINALKEMEKAKKEIQEREEKKAITQGAGGGPVAPKMNINASKMNRVANSRHQLSTLLKQAYENREALEEQIAQGKRNRKEAGNKYGENIKLFSDIVVTECTIRRFLNVTCVKRLQGRMVSHFMRQISVL